MLRPAKESRAHREQLQLEAVTENCNGVRCRRFVRMGGIDKFQHCERCAGRRQEKPVCSLCRSTGGILAEGAPPNCHAMLHNISCLSCKLNQKSGLAACFDQGFTVLVLWP